VTHGLHGERTLMRVFIGESDRCPATEERIRGVLPELDTLIGGGLITLEMVRVILYRTADEATR
jgi:hypothetical protein